MNKETILVIENLIKEKKIDEAQRELSKLGQQYNTDSDYLYLRGKVFYLNKLYYAAIDALLIAHEFEQSDKIYSLLGEIYSVLGNEDLSKKISDKNLRYSAVNDIKDTMTGLYRKKS